MRAQSETLNLIRPLSSGDEGSNGKDEINKVVENTNNNTATDSSLLRR